MSMELRWRGQKVQAAERAAAVTGVGMAMEFLLGEALKVVPIEDGTLANSGRTHQDGLTGAVSFDTPYAVIQHEDMSYQHDPGRSAKYLERPAEQNHDTMLAIVGEQIKQGLS